MSSCVFSIGYPFLFMCQVTMIMCGKLSWVNSSVEPGFSWEGSHLEFCLEAYLGGGGHHI